MNDDRSVDALLSVRALAVSFRVDKATTFDAVKGIQFDIPANSTVALVGESGSGKSVTALAIMGLLPKENANVAADSCVLFGGRNLLTCSARELQTVRGAELSMIFQEPMSSLNPVFSVGFQLMEVLNRHLPLKRGEARTRAVELLREVGIPEPESRIDAYPFELSGGQQQRVMIAMAIACEPGSYRRRADDRARRDDPEAGSGIGCTITAAPPNVSVVHYSRSGSRGRNRRSRHRDARRQIREQGTANTDLRCAAATHIQRRS